MPAMHSWDSSCILANGLSVVGVGQVDSKLKPGEKCVQAPLYTSMAYADFALCVASEPV